MKAEYGRAVRSQLRHFPVWDVGSSVAVGDYGIVDDFCFRKLGNLEADFEVTPSVTSSSPQFWEFASEGTKVGHIDAKAHVSDAGPRATLELSFANAYSLYVLAADSIVSSIENVAEVARQLRYHPRGWRSNHVLVVSARMTPSLILLMNSSIQSSIVLTADAGTLASFQGGRIAAGANLTVTGDAGLKCLGANGAVYVDLDRLDWRGQPRPAAEPFDGPDGIRVQRLDPSNFDHKP